MTGQTVFNTEKIIVKQGVSQDFSDYDLLSKNRAKNK